MSRSSKLIPTLVATLVIGLSTSASFAQETQAESKTTETEQTAKKPAKKPRPPFADAVDEFIEDLSEEQKEKIDEMQTEAFRKQKSIYESVDVTWKMNKQRMEILNSLSKEMPYKERVAKANEEAGYTEEQVNSLKEVGEVYRMFRYQSMQLITPEQQEKMPEWFKEDYKKSVEIAAKRAAEKAAADKEAAEKAAAENSGK